MCLNNSTIILILIIAIQLQIIVYNLNNNIILEKSYSNNQEIINYYNKYDNKFNEIYDNKYEDKSNKNYYIEKLWIHPLFNLMNHIVSTIYLLVMEYFKVFQHCFCYTLNILLKLINGYYHLLELLFKDILQYPTICYAIIGMFMALYQCNIIIKTILDFIEKNIHSMGKEMIIWEMIIWEMIL